MNKYPPTFQQGILSMCMDDGEFMDLMAQHCKDTYFESESMQWIFRLCQRLWRTTRSLLDMRIIDTELSKLEITDRATIGPMLLKCFGDRKDINHGYFKAEALTWLQKNVYVEGMRIATSIYNETEDFDKAVEVTMKAANTAKSMSYGAVPTVHMIRDWEDTYKERTRDQSVSYDFISRTGIPGMDISLDGGGREEELGCFLALPKSKKTITLCHTGVVSMRSGLPTLICGLEGRRRQMLDRVESMILQVPYGTVKADDIQWNMKKLREREARIYSGVSELAVRMMTQDYTYTVLHVEDEIAAMRAIGITPKVVIIDYADLLVPIGGVSNDGRYETQAQVFREVKRMAERNHVMVWTALQAKRPTKKVRSGDLLTPETIADSFEKARICDFCISLNESEEDIELNRMIWYLALCRDQPAAKRVGVRYEWEQMRLKEVEPWWSTTAATTGP